MKPREAHDRIARGEAVLLDVREQREWAQGHVEGALHIPMGQISSRAAELPADAPIVVACRSGNRSAGVTSALRATGYDAENLEGGLKAWARGGLPLGGPGRVA